MPSSRAVTMPAMPIKLIRTHLALAAVSGFLLLLAFPRPGWSWLAHVALVPITVLAVRSYSAKRLAWTTWLAGWVWWLVMIRWMVAIDWGGYVAVAAFLALYLPAAMLLIRWFHRCYRSAMVVTLPIVWVSLEIIRGLTPAGGWGWYCLGHSQAPYLAGQSPSSLIQCADLFGEPTVSFLVAMTNGLLADLVLRPLVKSVDVTGRRRMSRTILAGLGLWLSAMLAAWGYGNMRIRETAGAGRQGLRVAVVQTNVPQTNKEFPTTESENKDFDRLLALTRQAVAGHPRPALIVWPETMLPYPVNPDAREFFAAHPDPEVRAFNRFHDQTADMVAQSRVNLLAGADAVHFDSTGYSESKYNAVYLYRPDGSQDPVWYNKIHRVPFGEYVPWVEDWPWLKRWFILHLTPYGEHDYTLNAGTEIVIFKIIPPPEAAEPPEAAAPATATVRVATPICFEDTISRLTRRMVYAPNGVKQADMLVNLTNDGWFSGSDELLQHLQIAVMRSVELRVPVARSVNTGWTQVDDDDRLVRVPVARVNTGVSGFIDSVGRISPVVEVGGRSLDVEGVAVTDVKLDDRSSLFGRFGPWPGALLVTLTVLAAAGGLLRSGRRMRR